MHIANIYEAKTHLSKLLERVAHGEEIIIAKSGNPVAKLVPYTMPSKPRKPGCWKGKVTIADDFDAFSDDLKQLFDGED